MPAELETIKEYDDKLVAIISDFMLLAPLGWSKSTMSSFINRAKKGNFKLPKVSFEKKDYQDKILALENYIKELGKDDYPAISFLRETANSYLYAYRILQGAGTNDVSEFSALLYGQPSDVMPGYKRANIDIAKYFLRIVEEYKLTVNHEPQIYSSNKFKRELHKKVKAVFNFETDPVNLLIDSQITARAAAGSSYVKIRKNARFSKADLDQLFHHEVMIHTLTYVNGRKQPVLKTLGYNAPRTTATQEGLAVFAEYVNLSIDLIRLKRIALRIIAIDMAENGANLIDLFKFFMDHGQDYEESYYSAMRIFRGGHPQGGVIFYKDNVYLKGLIEVGAFFKNAMHQGRLHDIAFLFCGKITTSDVERLSKLSMDGHIIDPLYVPSWAANSSELAAHLAINDLTERFKEEIL